MNLAFEGRPGPVHITVPENLTHRGQRWRTTTTSGSRSRRCVADPGRVEERRGSLADALQRGKKVVALVGFGAIRSHAGGGGKRFVERFQIPLLTTLDGKGIVSEGHPLCVGVFSDSGHSSAWKAFREADVVLAVGNALNQHATFNYRDDLFTDKTLIHVNISATEIDKAYKADHALVSDAALGDGCAVDALDRRVGRSSRSRSTGRTGRSEPHPAT